uniref:Uncharacterized protein n=1 Tax=Anguilla anguilla TaxID=7936 RepID=A0A0E9QSF2_ANGAN
MSKKDGKLAFSFSDYDI